MASDRIEDTVKSLLTGSVPKILLEMIESEELKEISEIEEVFGDLKIEKKKLFMDLYNYKMFYKKTYQLQIFLKTVDNLIAFMNNRGELDLIDTYKCEIRKVINHLKEKVIFTTNFNSLNKLSKVQDIQGWIFRNRWKLEFILEIEMINKLFGLIQVLDILESDLLKINQHNLTEVQEEELKNHIKYIYEYSMQLSYESINYLKNLINFSTLTIDDKLKLLSYFQEINFRSQLKDASKIIDISERAFPMIFEYKICRLNEGIEIIEQVIQRNEECFKSCKNNFFQSTPDDQVTLDCLAIVFIYYLFEDYTKLYHLMKDDFEKNKKNQRPFSLLYFFEQLFILPHRIQCAVLQMLIQILSTKLSKAYDYITTYILNRSLVYEDLSQEYQNDFVLKASNQPFSDVLIQFLPTKSYDLRKSLQIMAKNTIIMNTPEKVAGFNLGNRMVVINQYKDDRKACTFYTFLYESGHFLQRIDKEIFRDNNRPHSPNLQIFLNEVEDIEADNHGPLSNANISKILASYLRPQKVARLRETRKISTEEKFPEIENASSTLENQFNEIDVHSKTIDDQSNQDLEKPISEYKESIAELNINQTISKHAEVKEGKTEEEYINKKKETMNKEKKGINIEESRKQEEKSIKNKELLAKEELLKKEELLEKEELLKKEESDKVEESFSKKENENQKNPVDIKKSKIIIEGGEILEIVIFGKQHDIIYMQGAEFLLSDLSGYNLSKFRKVFNEKNVKIDDEDSGQNIRLSEYSSIGVCGFTILKI